MGVLAPERGDLIVEQWLRFDAEDGPAGPLFPGAYTEHELTMTGGGDTGGGGYTTGCAPCTGSVIGGRPVHCSA